MNGSIFVIPYKWNLATGRHEDRRRQRTHWRYQALMYRYKAFHYQEASFQDNKPFLNALQLVIGQTVKFLDKYTCL